MKLAICTNSVGFNLISPKILKYCSKYYFHKASESLLFEKHNLLGLQQLVFLVTILCFHFGSISESN